MNDFQFCCFNFENGGRTGEIVLQECLHLAECGEFGRKAIYLGVHTYAYL